MNGKLVLYLEIERNRKKILHIIDVKCSILNSKSILLGKNYMDCSLALEKDKLGVLVDCTMLK